MKNFEARLMFGGSMRIGKINFIYLINGQAAQLVGS